MTLFDPLQKSSFAVAAVEGFGFVGRFVADAKVSERDECSPLTHSQVFAGNVVPRLPEAVSELKTMQSPKSWKWTVASLAAVLAVAELIEPKVLDVGSDVALEPKNSWAADHVRRDAGPMMVGTESGQVLVPMDLNWLQAALEAVPGLIGSRVAESGLEDFVMEAIH